MNIDKILMVDDDRDYFDLFMDILQDINPRVKVVYVNDACEIDEYLKPPFPNIIILDIRMPGMDGIDCLKKLRTNKELQKIPVIMNSITDARAEEAYKAGANHFIIKEGSIDKIKTTIKIVLEKDWSK